MNAPVAKGNFQETLPTNKYGAVWSFLGKGLFVLLI